MVFLHLVFIRNFCSSLKAAAHKFCFFQHKKTKGAATRDGKKKTLKSWLRVTKYFKSKFYSLQHVWKRCRLAVSHPQPNKCTSPAGMTQTEPLTPREGAAGNRSGELMQHSRLRAWAKLFVLRLQFQSQSVFKLLALLAQISKSVFMFYCFTVQQDQAQLACKILYCLSSRLKEGEEAQC